MTQQTAMMDGGADALAPQAVAHMRVVQEGTPHRVSVYVTVEKRVQIRAAVVAPPTVSMQSGDGH